MQAGYKQLCWSKRNPKELHIQKSFRRTNNSFTGMQFNQVMEND